MSDFNNRVIVVTGGSSGIGLAASILFAERGAQVLLTARRAEPLRAAVALHPNLAGLVADTANPGDAQRTIARAITDWGRIDVLVNNAGAGAIMPLSEVTPEQIESILATNITGPSMLARAALPYLAQSRGSIINISSTYGHKPAENLSHYAASKAALEHLTRCWALELAPVGIRVNAVAAGPTESGALTGMMGMTAEQAAAVREYERQRIPLGRRGEPNDVARWIVSLAHAEAEWITGQIITVDGGLELS